MLLWLLFSIVLLALLFPGLARLGRGAGWVGGAVFALLTAVLLARAAPVVQGRPLTEVYAWAPSLGVDLVLYLDGLSLLFALLITGVGALVLVFSGEYLRGDPLMGRFLGYLTGFAAAMLGLVLAGNLVTLFVFWELTSVASYLLIGHDHRREEVRAAALQALLVTAGGGLALLAAFLLVGAAAGTMDIPTLLSRGEALREHPLYLPILVLVLLGAFTKSAQFPFHFWLPSAMAAPTPASAYLHSVTMVKAGVYLLARLSPVLGGTAPWQWSLIAAGGTTMVLGAVMAVGQRDLKRLLAYSTVNALGTLVFLLGIGTEAAVHAALVFLPAHALYKGGLFLVAGAVDHGTGTRDIGRLRGLAGGMPLLAGAALLAALSMAGLPPLFGFIGKETVYQAVVDSPSAAVLLTAAAVGANVFLVAAAGLAVLLPFFGRTREPLRVHPPPLALVLGPLLLAGGGLALGLFPGLVDGSLIAPAAAAVLIAPTRVDLKLWHGVNPVLVLSLLTFAGGAALYAGRSLLVRGTEAVRTVAGWGPDRWYGWSLAALGWTARGQTRLLQHGSLSGYLRTVVGATLALAAFTFLRGGEVRLFRSPEGVQFFELGIAALVLGASVLAAGAPTRLGAIVAMGVIGYGVALFYVEFGAPDLAMTQFIIETITVILFVLVIYRLPAYASLSLPRHRLMDALLAGGGGLLVTVLVLAVLAGAPGSRLADFFAEQTFPAAHGRDIVNVILVDFRAMDTLGEIAVLGLAGTGVAALLRLRPRKGRDR